MRVRLLGPFEASVDGELLPLGGASTGRPGEVLVSRTVRDLVADSGLGFEPRDALALSDGSGEIHVYAVGPAAARG